VLFMGMLALLELIMWEDELAAFWRAAPLLSIFILLSLAGIVAYGVKRYRQAHPANERVPLHLQKLDAVGWVITIWSVACAIGSVLIAIFKP